MFAVVSFSVAQETSTSGVPNLISYSGTIHGASGNATASSRTLGVTFAIYKQSEGGAPLWLETQNVIATATGQYRVLLGSTSATGLPSDLFSPQEQRWLGVKVEGQPEQPRVLLVSVPYAMKAAEADTLAGHSASEFVTTNTLQSVVKDQLQQQSSGTSGRTTAVGVSSKLQGTSDPYVDNGTALQVGANFNIDGNGTVATLNATSQYLLGGSPVLGTNGGLSLFLGTQAGQNNTGNENTFLGMASGQSNTSGDFNTFVGRGAGLANTTGTYNTFIGRESGQTNTTGSYNSFFGTNAGNLNTTGSFNFFLGANTGYSNTTGTYNVFIGPGSGLLNTTGQYNTLVGANAGINSTTGTYNAFVGGAAGSANTSGTANTFLGMNSGITNTTGNNNVYIGAAAGVLANPAAVQNVYIATQGVATESNTIRMGDPWNQTATYISGIAGATTNSGVPVFVDATGKLGTAGGSMGGVTSFNGRTGAVVPAANDYNFSQITGSLQSSQFSGSYSNSVNLSNTGNSFHGAFIGNGSGLNGVLPAPGSNNYIQNTNVPQGANFNISGTGTVGGFFTAQSGLQAFNNVTNNAAIQGQDSNTSGQSSAVAGQTVNPTGVAVDGHAKATTGYSVGVQGEDDSTIGAGVIGVNTTTSGQNFGVLGYSGGSGGFGVMGTSPNVAAAGYNQTCTAFGSCTLATGIAGQFATQTGGTILQGLSGSSLAPVFSVDSSGNVTAAGIRANNVVGGLPVYVGATGKLGTASGSLGVTSFNGRTGAVVSAAGDYNFTLLNGFLQSPQLSGTYSSAVTLSNTSNVYFGNGSNLTGVVAGAGSPYYIQNSTSQQTSSNFNISGTGTAVTLNATTYQIGAQNALSMPSGTDNLFLGFGAGSVTTGADNAFLGFSAGIANTIGLDNTFTGSQAGFSNQGGNGNVFYGFKAGYSNVGGSVNVFVGANAGFSNTGTGNVFVGTSAGFANTSGANNVFSGLNAGNANKTGTDNVFDGASAGASNVGGNNNVFTGYFAGQAATGSSNTFLGYSAGSSITAGGNNIDIGANSGPSGNESNTIRIGTSTQTATFIAGISGATSSSGVNVLINTSGQLGTLTSSRRFKDNIQDMGTASSKLFQLRPVTFYYKPQFDDGSHLLQYGLIAEEVAKVYPDMVVYDKDGQPYTVRYQVLAPMLLNELQKQNAVVAAQQVSLRTQQQRADKQQGQIQTLQRQNEELQQRLSRLETLLVDRAQ